MRSLAVAFKVLVLFALASVVPAAVAAIFLKWKGALAAGGCVAAALAILSLRAEALIDGVLRPRPMRIGRFRARVIEDPSSHAFATHGWFADGAALWVTRGALSLLSPSELESLLGAVERAATGRPIRFETVLTSWIIRITSRVPSSFHDLLFFRQRKPSAIPVRESVRGMIWLSVALLLDRFYFAADDSDRNELPADIRLKLEAESRRCVPRLPPALSGHSAISPWPDSLLTLGRPCLLPSRAVNLGA